MFWHLLAVRTSTFATLGGAIGSSYILVWLALRRSVFSQMVRSLFLASMVAEEPRTDAECARPLEFRFGISGMVWVHGLA